MEHAHPGGRRNVSRRRLTRTLAAATGVGAGAVLLLAGPSAAHVRVLSEGAEAGKSATLKFRVPSEMETSNTVRLDIALPEGVTVDSTPAVEGWKSSVADGEGKEKGSTHLVWTAEAGHEIKPAESRTFTVRTEPLPDEAVLRFDTAQTYSDGSVVNWDQPSTGGEEPDFPVPELVLDADAVPAAPSPGGEPGEQPRPAAEAKPDVSAAPGTETAADSSEGPDVALAVWAVTATLAGVAVVTFVRRQLYRTSAGAGRDG